MDPFLCVLKTQEAGPGLPHCGPLHGGRGQRGGLRRVLRPHPGRNVQPRRGGAAAWGQCFSALVTSSISLRIYQIYPIRQKQLHSVNGLFSMTADTESNPMSKD